MADIPTSFAQRAYRGLMRCLSLPVLAWLWLRGAKDSGYRLKMKERLGHIEVEPASLDGLWIHAASVGEVQAARPLIDSLLAHWPAHAITVSTQSPTGARTLQALWGNRIRHVYAPIDTHGATGRFLDRLRPSVLVLMEREIWPELLWRCRHRKIPVALVNARLSLDSAQVYRRWRSVMAPVWDHLAIVSAADASSIEHYAALGVPRERMVLTGNLKFDQGSASKEFDEIPELRGRTILVAGSTHEGEEAALLTAWPDFARLHPGALLILVPRHPERFDSVAEQIAMAGLSYVRHSRGETPGADTAVLLADTMGELPLWYRQAAVCFIGGSLSPIGGHNALEAMAFGKPVLFGPHTHHFQELYEDVESCGAGERVDSGRLLIRKASEWIRDKSRLQRMGQLAREFVLSQRGSSQRTVDALRPLWSRQSPAALSPVTVQHQEHTTLWFDPGWSPADSGTDFFDETLSAEALATGSGRGQAERISLGHGAAVRRHYRRGGLMARLSQDRYIRVSTERSRAMAEFSLLRRMRAWGLPVPEPVAARQVMHGLSYTADIVVGMIPNTRNVAQALSESPLSSADWQAIGQAIRALHDRQVFHSDLNCHNLLLDGAGKAWVVDFDKCEVRSGQSWKRANLDRLQRSLRKEHTRRAPFHWDEAHWHELVRAYDDGD
ncbi:MAG: 3-deoxy-D-manno-octulosonic acid kinase [Hydrogenophaga sp.]|nr:3-deoxy-D-manno-octulosonic acid kinase [Hydrogenophaga sp.]